MKAKVRATAQKLLNLYRQAHVIIGGWDTVNQIFVDEADDNVIREIQDLPTGKMLVLHIENLRSGKTPMDSIERELLPYGGMMVAEEIPSVNLTTEQWAELEHGIENFVPNQEGLDAFTSLDIVKHFGEQWIGTINSVIQHKKHLQDKWKTIIHTFNAYRLWSSANEVISKPLTERIRAQVQADMPEYETYLPMFGHAGNELLVKLRTFISSLN